MTPAERNERRRRQLDRVRIMARTAQLERRAKEYIEREQKEVDELVKRMRQKEQSDAE